MSAVGWHAAAVGAVIMSMLSGPLAAAEDPLVQRGQVLVVRNCAQCHAVGLRDASPHREAPPLRELHRRYDVQNLEEALAEGILTGHPAMPEFRFAARDVKAIITYLKSLEPRARAAAPPAAGASR